MTHNDPRMNAPVCISHLPPEQRRLAMIARHRKSTDDFMATYRAPAKTGIFQKVVQVVCFDRGGGVVEDGRLPDGTGLSSATPIEPVPVSPVPASIPSAMMADLADRLARARYVAKRATDRVADLETTLRVLSRLSGETVPDPEITVREGGAIILRAVPYGVENAKAPIEIYGAVADNGYGFNAPAVRTQLWRMRERGVIKVQDSKYYRDAPAQAIEARRAETQSGSVHESAVLQGCAQNTPQVSNNEL